MHELQCSEEVLSEIASKCEGYDAYDLVILTVNFSPELVGMLFFYRMLALIVNSCFFMMTVRANSFN